MHEAAQPVILGLNTRKSNSEQFIARSGRAGRPLYIKFQLFLKVAYIL